MFSKWKCEMKVRYKPFTSQGVMDAITEASNEISSKDCQNWIQHVERFKIKLSDVRHLSNKLDANNNA
jgi:hypothetical protein